MSYHARRNDESDKETRENRSNQNNTSNIRNAASAAVASKNPYAVAAGAAIKGADKVTGGKASESLGKALTKANQMVPGGQTMQDAMDKLNESGLGNNIGHAANFYNGLNNNQSSPNQTEKNENKKPPKSNDNFPNGSNNQNNQPMEGEGSGKGNTLVKTVAILSAILIFPIILILIIIINGTVTYVSFEDGLGASYVSGEGIGGYVEISESSKEAQEFYERINEVKLEYAEEGKYFEAIKIVAVYHIMSSENNNITYKKMTKSKIMDIADAMFDEDKNYNEELFKTNLKDSIFKKQFPTYSDEKREEMAENVIEYISDYYSFIGESPVICAPIGTCSYQVTGFYYPNAKGNYYLNTTLEFSQLKVRLMQTGDVNGHDYGGTFGEALEDEELIPFEDYVLGVAYFEMGDTYPDEALKAQLVAARSFALARAFYTDDDWRTLEEETAGQWVLQIANSTTDQGFCNPDLGCSSTDAQYGQIHSGLDYTGWQKSALSSTSKLRTLANEVIGEVLVNEEGNIIHTSYDSTIKKKFIELANQGYDYKQILLEVYNNDSPSEATDIEKTTCTTAGTSSCNSASSGPYTSWKQYTGPWVNITLGNSGKTISQIGCAATSVAILIAKSGVPTTVDLNPGTFVQALNANGGFGSGNCLGCINWSAASVVAPSFKYAGNIYVLDYSKEEKFNTLKSLLDQGYYVTAEVKGNTGEHYVAIDTIQGNNIIMIDPGSTGTNLWNTYQWQNTSRFLYYKVV